ncbi:hypothetical protein D3C77_465680 [compost metagenome]
MVAPSPPSVQVGISFTSRPHSPVSKYAGDLPSIMIRSGLSLGVSEALAASSSPAFAELDKGSIRVTLAPAS